MSHDVHVFDYVNLPYSSVRDAMLADPHRLFEQATHAGARSAGDLGAELHVTLAGMDVGREVTIEVLGVGEVAKFGRPATAIALAWRATKSPGLFPTMRATLSIYSLTATETQLDLDGQYEPPLGVVGAALDAAVGHKLARSAVDGFIKEVAAYLRQSAPGTAS